LSNDSLSKIETEVKGCPLCRLSQTRKNAVAGEGQLSSKIMFIGEAPGKNEDQQGKPFVGVAGKVLDQLLKNAGIDRSQVFITNVVKCRPPYNRVPHDDEVDACRPYLNRQISLIDPEIICILGGTAYSSLVGGKAITSNRGKFIKKDGRKYFLTIHPAATIYNANFLPMLQNDILKLSKEIKKGKINNTTLDSTFEEVNNH
jgi:uracil-DNA glycosylase family 4